MRWRNTKFVTMNQFGRIFRISIWGESHGPAVGVVIDGCKAGIPISVEDFAEDLRRRQGGGAATTPRKEDDVPEILSGVLNNHTTGAPISILFRNRSVRSEDYAAFAKVPRPGHADFVAHKKFQGYNDPRGGGHFSGRLTAPLVAAGVVAKKLLQYHHPEIKISAVVTGIGGLSVEEGKAEAIRLNDSLGGVVECTAEHVPLGWGEPFFDAAESLIAHLAFAIPAIKGIAFGSGFSAATMRGSEHNDALINTSGETRTNHSGGITGGITNGNPLKFQVAVKPASSTPQPQETLRLDTGTMEQLEVKGRHDLVIALRVPPVLEAITAIALADMMMRYK